MNRKKLKNKNYGLSLNLKVDIIALVALLLSIGSLLIQAVQYWRGAQIVMTIGERVNLIQHTPSSEPKIPYLLINARLDYINTGAVGRDAIITGERVLIRFGDLVPYEYRWLHYELFLPNDEGDPEPKTEDGAHSFIVPGSSSATHQTTFVPFRDAGVRTEEAKAAPISWKRFDEWIGSNLPMILKFSAIDRRGISYDASCRVLITDPIKDALRQKLWATALCE